MELSRGINRSHALLVSILICLAAFFAALLARNGQSVPLRSAIRLNASSLSDVQVQGDHVYYLEGGSLHCVNTKGKFVWNAGVDAASNFSVNKSGLAVWSGTRLTTIDINTGVPLGNIQLSQDVSYAVMGDVYSAAVIGPEHSSQVVLTDRYGNTVDTLTDFDEVLVMDCGFFEGREIFWIMTLDSTGSEPVCRISTYKPGRRETGQINDMEQLIYRVIFRSNSILAVGTRYMAMYDYTGNETKSARVNLYGYYLEAADENEEPTLLFCPSSQTGAVRDARAIFAGNEYLLHMPVECRRLLVKDQTVYGISRERLAVTTLGTGDVVTYLLPMQVNDVIGITADKTAVITSGGAIYLIRLP